MIRSAALAFYRSLARHPLYATLNLLGLSFGIAVFITLGLYVRFETGFESWIPHAKSIHIVRTTFRLPGFPEMAHNESTGAMLDILHQADPSLKGTRVWENTLILRKGNEAQEEQEQLVDPDFFTVFDLDLIAGDKSTALSQPGNILLTERMARKYFGRVDVLGKTLHAHSAEGVRDYRISGVIRDLPANTDFHFDFVRLLTPQRMGTKEDWDYWGSLPVYTYVLFKTPADVARFNSRIDHIVDTIGKGLTVNNDPVHQHVVVRARALPGLHMEDETARTGVFTLGVVGLLAFAVAVINYINLATARAGMRAREVAIRKAMGATESGLRMQFLAEALFMSLLAGLLGLSLVELTLPLLNRFGGMSLALDYVRDAPVLLGLVGAVLLAGMLAGLYPAFVLSAFEPAQVLTSSRSPTGGRLAMIVREILVVIQFGVVGAFFTMVLGFVAQLHHMETADLGFGREGLLISESTGRPDMTPAQYTALSAQWRALPGVVSVTDSAGAPGVGNGGRRYPMQLPGGGKGTVLVSHGFAGPDFFTTYKAHLLAGRVFTADDQVRDDTLDVTRLHRPAEGVETVVCNLEAVKELGLASPQAAVGHTLNYGAYRVRIVGVVTDLRFGSPKAKILPTLYFFDAHPHKGMLTTLRFAGVAEPVMRDRMQIVWRRIVPDLPFQAVSAVENLDKYYRPDRGRSNLFSVGAGMAALIGCIGLYGLAAFNTSRRSLEIGLRKALGATRRQVIVGLVGQLMRPVLLANLIAWPIGYLALRHWLAQFDDAVTLNPAYFLVSSALSLAIAIATVGGLAFASASAEPGKALRRE